MSQETEITEETSALEKLRAAVRCLNLAKAESELAMQLLDSARKSLHGSPIALAGACSASAILQRTVLDQLTEAIIETMKAVQKEETP